MPIVVRLSPVYVEASSEYLGRARLRKFQKDLVDIREGVVVLSAPTGSGKTVTVLTDRVTFALYPNNELVCNQVTGLRNFLIENLGMYPEVKGLSEQCQLVEGVAEHTQYELPVEVLSASEPVDFFNTKTSRVVIVGMSGKLVKSLGDQGKLGALEEATKIAEEAEKRGDLVIYMGTPDTYFLLALYLYQDFEHIGRLVSYLTSLSTTPESLTVDTLEEFMRRLGFNRERLSRITRVLLPSREATLFIDEYHLYSAYEITSLRALLWTLREVHGWSGRLVLSSATPARSFLEEMKDVFELLGAGTPRKVTAETKISGSDEELVRGSIKLVVHDEIVTDKKSKLGKLYASSASAYQLIETSEFKEFLENFRAGRARGIVILEKVSHVEDFVDKLPSDVKPICLYSLAKYNEKCGAVNAASGGGGLLVVGTGAKIGQGVEFRGVTFGVVARAFGMDFLQSLSRVGRRVKGESLVLVPMDETLAEKFRGLEGSCVNYDRFVEWLQSKGSPYVYERLESYYGLLRELLRFREDLLRAVPSLMFYRLSGSYKSSVSETPKLISKLSGLKLMSPPDAAYSLLMFRRAGPSIEVCLDKGGVLKCVDESGKPIKEDFGVLARNYGLVADSEGRLVASRATRDSAVEVECEKASQLEALADGAQRAKRDLLAEWSVLRDLFGCRSIASKGGNVKSLDSQLEGQLFLVYKTSDEDLSDYVSMTGIGLRVKNSRWLLLLFV
ncbi:MAG: hypothetical protein ACP5KA_06810 [Desulfurococcaceae archaeon]